MSGLFITATGTGVGKTLVTAAVVAALRDEGLDVGAIKLVQTGADLHDPLSDAGTLKRLAALSDEPDQICPLSLPLPVAPYVAARAAGVPLEMLELLGQVRERAERHEHVCIEGVGGVAVPLSADALVLDAIAALGHPVLVVASAYLGTINHTLLTAQALRGRGVEVVGVVLNAGGSEGDGPGAGDDPSVRTNAEVIEAFAGVPVLGVLPSLPDERVGPALGRWLAAHCEMGPIRGCFA